MADNLSGSTEIENVLFGNSESDLDETTTEEVADVSEEETEETTEEEESESEGVEDEDEEEELTAIEIDGEEVTLDQIGEWKKEAKDGGLRLSDYTKKTMALAEDRKKVVSLNTKLEDSIAELEALIESGDSVDLDELWEVDPAAARKHEKKLENRKKALEAAKRKGKEVDAVKLQEESSKLRDSLPEWFNKDGSLNEQQKKDAVLIQKYAKKIGVSPDDLAGFTDHRIILALLDGAKYHDVKGKAGKAIKVKKKSNGTSKTKAAPKKRSIEDIFYG